MLNIDQKLKNNLKESNKEPLVPYGTCFFRIFVIEDKVMYQMHSQTFF
jgi:hypothetical protein